MADPADFIDSLMGTSLYSLGAGFQDDHPELVDDVIARADQIEQTGLEAWSAANDTPLESAYQTLVTGLALRYYRAISG